MKKGKRVSLFIIVLILIIIGSYLLYLTPFLNPDKPTIMLNYEGNNTLYWNLQTPIKVKIKDKSGLKKATATLSSNTRSVHLLVRGLNDLKQDQHISLYFPEEANRFNDDDRLVLNISAQNSYKLGFIPGSTSKKSANVIIDTKKPEILDIASSYKINRGGSAVVVFKATDENLKNVYIETSFGQKFKVLPFYKRGYYVSLLAWPATQDHFRAKIVASDKANNLSLYTVRMYYEDKKFDVSNITLRDNYLTSKVFNISEEYPKGKKITKLIDRFKYLNGELRKEEAFELGQVSLEESDSSLLENFNIKRFNPIKNPSVTALFGTHRIYFYDGQNVGESYHLGIDLASISKANVISSNLGRVVYDKYLGIYGNTLIIDHGFGIFSQYSHLSKSFVHEGDVVKAGQLIAKTGQTGLAMGDHLHFSILIQGISVNPIEWFDSKWIKDNIAIVIDNSKKSIDNLENSNLTNYY